MCLAAPARVPLYREKQAFFLKAGGDGKDNHGLYQYWEILCFTETQSYSVFFPFLLSLHHHKNVSFPYLVLTLESVMWGRKAEKSKPRLNPQTTAAAPVESHTALLLHFPPDQSWLGLNIQPRFCITQTQLFFKLECLHISSSGSDWFDEDHRPLAKGLHLHLPNLLLYYAEARFLCCSQEGADLQRGFGMTNLQSRSA